VAAVAIFTLWPDLDLTIERIFFGETGRFVVGGPVANFARQVGIYLPLLVLAALLLAGAARALGLVGRRYGPTGRGAAFLALTIAIGPGLLVNVVLKDHSHRPRPVQVTEFQGKDAFRPFYRFDGACDTNCSFVSGETSSAVWLVAPALLAPPAWRSLAVGAALSFGLAVGLLRMGFGHHFPSDVVFAALLTLLVIAGLHRWLLGRAASPAAIAQPRLAPARPGPIVAPSRRPGE